MIDSVSAADVANAERFQRIGIAADAASAGRTRGEFARWLEEYFDLDPIRSSDLVLATNEALANAAEFAYLRAGRPGTMDVHARHHPDGKLTVTVSDNGTWRIANPAPPNRSRGRGIPLMRAVTDRTTIETSTRGTQVCLEWAGVQPRLNSAAADGSG